MSFPSIWITFKIRTTINKNHYPSNTKTWHLLCTSYKSLSFSCKSKQLNLPLMTHPSWKSHGLPKSVVHNYCKCQCVEALQCKGVRGLVSILRTQIETRLEPAHNQQCILHGNINHLLHSNHIFRLDALFTYSCTVFAWCIPHPIILSLLFHWIVSWH